MSAVEETMEATQAEKKDAPEKKKIGRPPIDIRKLTISLGNQENIKTLASFGVTIPIMAKLFGVDDNTLYRRLDPKDTTFDPAFREAFKMGEALDQCRSLIALNKLVDAGNTAAVIYSCKTKCGMLEVRKTEGTVEHKHNIVCMEDVIKAAKQIDSAPDVIEGEVLEEESV